MCETPPVKISGYPADSESSLKQTKVPTPGDRENADLSTGCKFLGKDISGRFTIGSGIVTVTLDTVKLLAEKVPQLGVLTTKSIGPEERTGNREPVYVDLTQTKNADRGDQPAWANAVGLAGPGCDNFLKELEGIRLPPGKFLLVSIFGGTTEDFVKVARTLAPYADGLELNFSCPHAEGHGQAICATPGLAAQVVAAVRAEVGPTLPLVPKLSPNLDDSQLEALVPSLLDAGSSAFTAINTVGPVENMHAASEMNILSKGKGGMSGHAVKARGLHVVSLVRRLCDAHGRSEVPIIGMGGVATFEDCEKFAGAGADIIGVGSSLTGLSTEELVARFAELAGVGKPVPRVVPADLMHFKEFTLRSIEQVNPDLGLLYFEEGLPSCQPGQFISAWVPGTTASGEALGEKPFAPAIADDARGMCLAVRAVGTLTGHLLKNLAKGDKVHIRGPYGKPFFVPESVNPESNFVMVGGGTGIAPLLLLAEKLLNAGVSKDRIWVYLGGRSEEHIYFEEEFKAYSSHVAVATNDGSRGFKGFVTDCLKADIPQISEGAGLGSCHFYNCGPELMMKNAVTVQEAGSFASIECSVERYMKCGVGICGVCSCDGYRTCVDGPIFGYDFLSKSEMFGKKHRAKTTKLLDW